MYGYPWSMHRALTPMALYAPPVEKTLNCLQELGDTPALQWLHTHRAELEAVANCPWLFRV